MITYCDCPYQLSFPYSDVSSVDITWVEIEHLLPSIQCCGFDSRAGFLALYLQGGYVQLCDVFNGTIIPQSHFLLPESGKKMCNTIAWSLDARHLILSLSWKLRAQGAAEHEIIVWDVLSSVIAHRVRTAHSMQYLQPLDNSDLLLCHSAAPSSPVLQLVHIPTRATSYLSSSGEAGGELAWVEGGPLDAPSPSDGPLCVRAAACRFFRPDTLELYIVAEDLETQSLALHKLRCRMDGTPNAALETRRLCSRVLSPPLHTPVHLSLHHDLLLLSAPLSSVFQLYALHEDELVPEATLSAGPVGKDCVCVSCTLTSFPFAAQPTAVIVLQQSSRLHPATRVLLWSRGTSHAAVLKQSGLAVHRVHVSGTGLVLGVDATGKARTLPVEPKTSFAGAMYPVGYELINSVRTYEEKEDELDKPLALCTPTGMGVGARATHSAVTWSPRAEQVVEYAAKGVGGAENYLSALPYSPVPLSRAELRTNTAGTATVRGGLKHTDSAPVPMEVSCMEPPMSESSQRTEEGGGGEEKSGTQGAKAEDEEELTSATGFSATPKTPNCFAFTTVEALLPPPRRISSGDYQNNLLRKRQHYDAMQALGRDADARFREFVPSCVSVVVSEAMKVEKRRQATEERRHERKKARDSALLQVVAAMQQQQQEQLLLQQQEQEQLLMQQQEQEQLLLQQQEQEQLLMQQQEQITSQQGLEEHEGQEEPAETSGVSMELEDVSLEKEGSREGVMQVVASALVVEAEVEEEEVVAAPVAEQAVNVSDQYMEVAIADTGAQE